MTASDEQALVPAGRDQALAGPAAGQLAPGAPGQAGGTRSEAAEAAGQPAGAGSAGPLALPGAADPLAPPGAADPLAPPPGSAASSAALAAGPAAGGRRPGAGPRQPLRVVIIRGVATSLLLLALLIIGFAGYLFGASNIQEASAQHRLYTTLARQLGKEIGPLGPVPPGRPVAIMNIPEIGMKNVVVVEGTTGEDMTRGPGHVRSTPLPGQLGASVIYGRRETFGAPFGRLGELRPGDTIGVITQQGTSQYRVAAIGDSQHPVEDSDLNRLVLLTASSRDVPAYFLEIDADLTSKVSNGPVQLPAIGSSEQALAGDTGVLVLTMTWALALALVSVGASAAATRWSAGPVYLVTAPIVLAIAWNLYENLAALLPNLY
jgi:sortase A